MLAITPFYSYLSYKSEISVCGCGKDYCFRCRHRPSLAGTHRQERHNYIPSTTGMVAGKQSWKLRRLAASRHRHTCIQIYRILKQKQTNYRLFQRAMRVTDKDEPLCKHKHKRCLLEAAHVCVCINDSVYVCLCGATEAVCSSMQLTVTHFKWYSGNELSHA